MAARRTSFVVFICCSSAFSLTRDSHHLLISMLAIVLWFPVLERGIRLVLVRCHTLPAFIPVSPHLRTTFATKKPMPTKQLRSITV